MDDYINHLYSMMVDQYDYSYGYNPFKMNDVYDDVGEYATEMFDTTFSQSQIEFIIDEAYDLFKSTLSYSCADTFILKDAPDKINTIRSKPQPTQRTKEW